MYRTLIHLFICFIAFLPAKAEVGVSVGARAGFNIAHLRNFTAPDLYKKRITFGSDIAAVLRIDFNKHFGIQTEVEFTQKGQGWHRTLDSAKYASKVVINYIQFPVLAVARVGKNKIKGVFCLGPYFAYWAGGYTQSAVSVDKETRTSNTERYVFTKNDMRFDVGLTMGAGADFKVGKGWIELMSRYNVGFLPTAKLNSGLPKMYNCNFNISVGYLYTIK